MAIRCRPTRYHTGPTGLLCGSISLQVSGSRLSVPATVYWGHSTMGHVPFTIPVPPAPTGDTGSVNNTKYLPMTLASNFSKLLIGYVTL